MANQVFRLVPINQTAAARFAEIKTHLSQRGLVKSDADLLIASSAIEDSSVLITHDSALLDGEIPDLHVEDWLVDSGLG